MDVKGLDIVVEELNDMAIEAGSFTKEEYDVLN